MKSTLKQNVSLASYPGFSATTAMGLAVGSASDDALGTKRLDHIQICPQNTGALNGNVINELIAMSASSKFRLHANVRIEGCLSPRFDLSSLHEPSGREYFRRLAALSCHMKAEGYTLHPGDRRGTTFGEIRDQLEFLQDLFQCPVGIEGMYPGKGYLLDTWNEYQALLEFGVKYALDLSHVNIVSCHEGKQERTLLAEMLSSDQCLEVHLSHNDGKRDSHERIVQPPWWIDLLDNIQPHTVVFNEGVEIKPSTLRQKC